MIPFAPSDITSRITGAIRDASRATGAGFDFLLRTAMRESSMNPQAKAPTSSAAGLFQFIESTWLSMVKEEGEKHGLGQYADQIVRNSNGRYQVPDAGARREILALRHDPETSAAMAGELTLRNRQHLVRSLGREPSEGELYIAHFLGARDAANLIRLAAQSPETEVVSRFPRQAAANRSIFFQGGEARSAIQVYRQLVSKHEAGPAGGVSPRAAEGHVEEEPVAPLRSPLGDRFAWAHDNAGPVFHALFTAASGEPANQIVESAWSQFAPGASDTPSRRFAAIVSDVSGAYAEDPAMPRARPVPPEPGIANAAPRNLLPYSFHPVPSASGGSRV